MPLAGGCLASGPHQPGQLPLFYPDKFVERDRLTAVPGQRLFDCTAGCSLRRHVHHMVDVKGPRDSGVRVGNTGPDPQPCSTALLADRRPPFSRLLVGQALDYNGAVAPQDFHIGRQSCRFWPHRRSAG